MLSIFSHKRENATVFLCGCWFCQCSTENKITFSPSNIINLYNLFSCKLGFCRELPTLAGCKDFCNRFSFVQTHFILDGWKKCSNLIKSNNQVYSRFRLRLSKFRFTIYKVNKASKKKREKSSAKKERKATKTLAIVLGKHIKSLSLHTSKIAAGSAFSKYFWINYSFVKGS